LTKEELVLYFAKWGVKSKIGCCWVKIIRPNTNGKWMPLGAGIAYDFRGGVCIGYLRNTWIMKALEDETCEVYPAVTDVPKIMVGIEKKHAFADDENSVMGKPFREYYYKPVVVIEELQKLQEEIKALEVEKQQIETEIKREVKRGRPKKV